MRDKSPIQIPICDITPTAPSPGNVSIFSKADGVYTVDETGEEKKLGSGGNDSIPTDVAERIEKLENQQKRVNVEFIDTFDSMDNIQSLDRLRILNGELELIKSSNTIIEEFNADSIIDKTASMNVITESGRLVIDNQLNLISNGVMTTNVIDVETTDTVVINAGELKPYGYTGESRLFKPGNQWVLIAKDSSNNMWSFSIQHRTYTTNIPIELNIYDSNGDLLKTTTVYTPTTKYCVMFGGNISFDKFGNVYLMITLRDDINASGTHAGYNFNNATNGSDISNLTGVGSGNGVHYLTLMFNSMGDYQKSLDTYKYMSSSYYRGMGITGVSNFVFSSKGYCVILNHPNGALVTSGATNGNTIAGVKSANSEVLRVYTVSKSGEFTFIEDTKPLTVGGSSNSYLFHWNIFNRKEDIYVLWGNRYSVFSATNEIEYTLSKINYYNGTTPFTTVHEFTQGTRPLAMCGGINGSIYNSLNDSLYIFSGSGVNLRVCRFIFNEQGITNDLTKEYILEKKMFYANYCHAGVNAKFIVGDNLIHIAYIGADEGGAGTSLRYMSIDFDGNIVTQPSLVFYKETNTVNQVSMEILGDDLVFAYGYGSTTSDKGVSEMAIWKPLPTDISYEILNVSTGVWHGISNGNTLILDTPTDKLKVRITLTSPQYYISPAVERMVLEYKTNEDKATTSGEMVTKRLPSVSSSGRGVLTADYTLNDGTIDWFVSFDGGISWKAVQIGYEFIFNYTSSPDFRIKAIIQIPAHDSISPVISSYTLRTDSVVLHSDIEEIQVNLMKTNFKIDSFTKATKNDLLKMTIDTFSDDSGIDYGLSTCTFNPMSCSVSGDVVVSREEETSSTMTYILLTSDEMLPYKESYVEYYVSRDSGKTYTKIDKDIKSSVTKPTTNSTNTVKVKALLFNGAELNAWAWAWN